MSIGDIQGEALREEKEALEWLKSGKLELAKYRLAKLCKEYPHIAKFRFNHALVLYKLKQYKDALDEITTGLWLKPDDEKASRFKQEVLALLSKSKPGARETTASPGAVDVVKLPAPSKQDEGDQIAVTSLEDARTRSSGPRPPPRPSFVDIQKMNFNEPGPYIDVEWQPEHAETGEPERLDEQALVDLVLQIKELGKQAEDEAGARDDPRFKEAMIKIKKAALALYESAQYEQALMIYSTLLDSFPEDLEALFNIGFCQREMNNFHESENTFKHIIELFYDNAYAWHNLALIYAITNEGDKEVYCLQKARDFGYFVDNQLLSHLALSFTPRNPFDSG